MIRILLIIIASTLGCVAETRIETPRTDPEPQPAPIIDDRKDADSESSESVPASDGSYITRYDGGLYWWRDASGKMYAVSDPREGETIKINGVPRFVWRDGRAFDYVEPVAVKPIVYVYLNPFECAPCEAWKAAKDSMPEFDWRVREVPEWVAAYPTFHITSPASTTGWRKIEGWTGPDEFRREWEALQ